MASATVDPHQVEAALLALPQSNNDTRVLAEKFLTKLLKRSSCVPAFLQQVQCSQHQSARQLAALLLRKRMVSHWIRLTGEQQASVKQLLLSAMHAESARPVVTAVAALSVALGRFLVPNKQWDELIQFAIDASSSAKASHREAAMLLFYSLFETDTIATVLTPHAPSIAGLVVTAMQDAEPRVRVMAGKAGGAILEHGTPTPTAPHVRPLIEGLFMLSAWLVEQGDDDSLMHVMDVLASLCSSADTPLEGYAMQVAELGLRVARDTDAELGTREGGALLFQNALLRWPNAFVKAGVLRLGIEMLLSLLAEPPEDEEDDPNASVDPNAIMEVTAQRVAQQVLDAILQRTPTKHTFRPLVEGCVALASHADVHHRAAAMTALGVGAEGLMDRYIANLAQVVALLGAGLRDAEARVQEKACFGLGQVSVYLKDYLSEHHAATLPHVCHLLVSSIPRVVQSACYVLEAMLENLTPEQAQPYVDPISQALLAQMQRFSSNAHVVRSLVAAIGALAVGAKTHFTPAVPRLMPVVLQIMALTGPDTESPRSEAVGCFGYIADAVGAAPVAPYVDRAIELAWEGFNRDEEDELTEYGLTMFSNLAEVFPEKVSALLPELLAVIRSTLSRADVVYEKVMRGEVLPELQLEDDEDDE
eukprot:CAMPEP_0196776920 /NCGR_PEP_ID=MMETSP1104-20130614/4917_1 /TAXON_ID=33652 /ORGANISM="Cafeteria sp., Strain Caron Lab Isolate" /LENGTH=647 /DNA_ID=CAMNT_0042147089 /DNA_START=89 /DNA_END=2029 /DNA_ORIENTATION=+